MATFGKPSVAFQFFRFVFSLDINEKQSVDDRALVDAIMAHRSLFPKEHPRQMFVA